MSVTRKLTLIGISISAKAFSVAEFSTVVLVLLFIILDSLFAFGYDSFLKSNSLYFSSLFFCFLWPQHCWASASFCLVGCLFTWFVWCFLATSSSFMSFTNIFAPIISICCMRVNKCITHEPSFSIKKWLKNMHSISLESFCVFYVFLCICNLFGFSSIENFAFSGICQVEQYRIFFLCLLPDFFFNVCMGTDSAILLPPSGE